MNPLILSLDSFTPPKPKRQSLPLISKPNYYSLHLSRHLNPPQILITAPKSHRSKKPGLTDRPKLLDYEQQPSLNYPLSSRKSHDKHGSSRERRENTKLFLVRNKNNSCKRRVFLKSLSEEEIGRGKRDFDEYLTYIRSSSVRYTVSKAKKKEEEGMVEIARTIQHIFYKVWESLESNPKGTKQLCVTYLSLFEKAELENSISISANQSPLSKLFILQRLICYYIIILFDSNKFCEYEPLFIKATHCFCTLFESLIQIIRGKEVRPGIGSTVRATQFLCEVEKGCNQIMGDMKLLTKPLSRELYEADKQLMLLLNHVNDSSFTERLAKLQSSLNWKLLKLPPIPYLPPSQHPYTLLLQLDTTLTFYDSTNKLLMFRPYLQQFLDTIPPLYQLVIYTIGVKEYADAIIDEIDPMGKIFKARLYNEHISLDRGEYFRDLSKLGRVVSSCLVLDSEEKHCGGYEENRIEITKWYGDELDDSLVAVSAMLREMVETGTKSARKKGKNKPLLTHISEQPEQTLASNK